MKRASVALFVFLQGCVASPEVKAPPLYPNACPPLPILEAGATRFEERLHNETVKALYAQCAESKK